MIDSKAGRREFPPSQPGGRNPIVGGISMASMLGRTYRVQDWPYANLSSRSLAPAPSLVLSASMRQPPIEVSHHAKMVAGVRQVLGRPGLVAGFGESAAGLNPFVSGYRGDYDGAALSLLATGGAAVPVSQALQRGQHLSGPGLTAIVQSLGLSTLRAIASARDTLAPIVEALPANLRGVLRQLRQHNAIPTPTADALTRAFDPVLRGIDDAFARVAQTIDTALGSSPDAPSLASIHSAGSRGAPSGTAGATAGPGSPRGRGARPRDPGSDAALHQAMTTNLQGGLRYAASLHQRGLAGPSRHISELLHTLAPEAVPADITPRDLATLATTVRVGPTNRKGPLFDIAGVRGGDEDAARRLSKQLAEGEFAARVASEKAEDWRFSKEYYTYNDNMAPVRDPLTGHPFRSRSDDGPTMSIGRRWSKSRGSATAAERWSLNLDYNMFTERNGMSRTDLTELTVQQLKAQTTGRVLFDTVTTGWLVGLQSTGNLGGAIAQDIWHAGTGWLLGGRRLGKGLQDQYVAPFQVAALLGAEVRLDRHGVGPFDFGVGTSAKVPVGPTGVGRVSAHASTQARISRRLSASVGIEGAFQWTQGRALEFDGTPGDGFVVSPRVGIGWRFRTWNIGVQWVGNHWGTQPGFGDRNGESVGISLGFSR